MPGNLDIKVLLHTDKTTAALAMGATAAMLKPQPEGLLLSSRTDSAYCFALWLSQLPFDFTVLAPVELKQALQQQAARLLQIAAR